MPTEAKALKSMKAQERRWQAEDDARTLARVNTITEDPARLKRAQTQATRMQKDAEKEANSLRKVSGGKPRLTNSTPPKPKIKSPAKRGSVPKKVIKKAVKSVSAKRKGKK